MWAKALQLIGPMIAGADKAGMFVRLLRFLYGTFGITATLAYYTGWRNQRIAQGDDTLPIPGLDRLSKRFSAARPDAPLPASPSASAPAGGDAGTSVQVPQQATGNHTLVPVSGVDGAVLAWASPKREHASYDPAAYTSRLSFVKLIASNFNTHVTSGYRSAQHNAAVGGAEQSLHVDGLAFDSVGRMEDMQRMAYWAHDRPDLFQEVFLHDEGSGLHVHLALWPTASTSVLTTSIHHRHPSAGQHLSPQGPAAQGPFGPFGHTNPLLSGG